MHMQSKMWFILVIVFFPNNQFSDMRRGLTNMCDLHTSMANSNKSIIWGVTVRKPWILTT